MQVCFMLRLGPHAAQGEDRSPTHHLNSGFLTALNDYVTLVVLSPGVTQLHSPSPSPGRAAALPLG